MTNPQTEARANLWVPAKPEHAKLGWTYDFEQTERISRAAYDSTGYEATMEVVEFVMAEADRRHATALAAKDAELAAERAALRLAADRADRAEAKLAGGEAVKVKPLEWVDGEARTPFGSSYTVHRRADSMYEAVGCGAFVNGPHPDRVSAKAAAQADYERRILSALEPAAPEGAAARLRKNLTDFDAEVAYELSTDGERADLWGEIDVNVEDLRAVLASRPTERAVTEAMVEAAQRKYREIGERCNWQYSWPSADAMREILKAAMEAGR